MRKLLLVLIFIFITIFSAHAGDITRDLKVGAFELYPSIFTDPKDGKIKGLCVDLLEEIACKENWSLTFVEGTWNEGLLRIKNKDIDIITTAVYTEERDLYMDYGSESFLIIWTEVYANPKVKIRDVFNMTSKKIGVMTGDWNARAFREYMETLELECNYVYFDTQKDVLHAVEHGKVDVGVVNNITGSALSHKYKIVKTNVLINPRPIYFTVPSGKNSDIIDIIDRYLYEWKSNRNSFYYKKLDEWFVDDFRVEKEVPTYVIYSMMGLLILLIFSISMIFLLRKLISIRTKQLKEAKDRFECLFKEAPLSYQSLDSEGNIIEVNDSWLDTTGYLREDVIGHNFSEFLHSEWKKHFEDNFPKFKAVGEILGAEFELKKKDGSFINVAFHGKIAHDHKNKFKQTHCVFRDITDQREIEKKLMHSQKMESVGTLAAGIAHDFNNILFIMMSTAQLLMMDLSEEEKYKKHLVNIIKAGDRGTYLIKQILSFSRQAVQEITSIDIKPVLKEVIKLTRATTPTNINITHKLDNTESYVVNADPTQIHQIILNLLTNAYHAVEDIDGEIEVELTKVDLFNGALVGKDLKPGKYVHLKVTDNGYGIDSSYIDKIFDPYFTTKPAGKGTGLGLSVVYGIIKEYNGDIKVYSEVDKGTVFSVYLPLSKDFEVSKTRVDMLRDATLDGEGTVMLLDDEQQIVLIEKLYFTRHGYVADTFTSSMAALETYKRDPNKYDVVITDMAMPKIPGDKLCRQILEINPDQKIIMCSGFSEKMNEKTAEEMGIDHYLMKPVDVSVLIKLTKDLIEKNNK